MRSDGPVESRSDYSAARKQGHNSPGVSGEGTTDHDEQRKLLRLQWMMNLVVSVIAQDKNLTVDQAAEIVASSKKAALDMFPEKELAYNLIYRPRIQRVMRERFRIQ